MDINSCKTKLDEPIGKQKPTKIVIGYFTAGFLSASSIQWMFLDAFDYHKKIFIDSSSLPWLYYILISVIIGLSTAWYKQKNYYRHLYHYYRDMSWVDNFYLTRSSLQSKYLDLIKSAESNIDIFGMSLHTLISNQDIIEAMIIAGSKKRVKIRILLHHHECRFLKDRALQEKKEPDEISAHSKRHLNEIKEIKKKNAILSNNLSIKTIKDVMPDCFFFRQDNKLFVEPYLLGYIGRDCPVFSMIENSVNSSVFQSFINAMERKWEKGVEV